MVWVLVLIITTSVPGKADISRRWVMPSQAACETQLAKARIANVGNSITVTATETTSVETRVESPLPSALVLACVQEPKP